MVILTSVLTFLFFLPLAYCSQYQATVTVTSTVTQTVSRCSTLLSTCSATVITTLTTTLTSTAYTTAIVSQSDDSSTSTLSSYDPHIYTSTTTAASTSSVIVSLATVASSSTSISVDPCAAATGQLIVDLEYSLHSARLVESPDGNTFFNFSNIRYAAPPVGSLRFQAPLDPINNRSAGVQDGSYGKICPQAYAPWQNSALVTAPPGENESEDCLFLDVVVSKETWDNRCTAKRPVIVWFHGGGFQIGSKYGAPASSPIGLLDRSFKNAEGAIWIGMNYRLGAFGFLQGDSFQSSGGQANAGFYDQRKALDWIQKYVQLFGGDPNRITVTGESAGGGSIFHHITAYGGKKNPAPINRAIVQSPAFIPRPLESQAEDSYQILLQTAGVSDLTELKALSTYDLQVANKLSQTSDFYGVFQFGPAPDGDYVLDLPGKLLATGKFDKTIPILAAHNTAEGTRYTDPAATNNSAFTTYMKLYFPQASVATLLLLADGLYPPIYDGIMPYTTPFQRLMLAISEFTFTCNAYWMACDLGPALGRNSYSYLFSIPPGTHTLDVPYTYFTNASSAVVNTTAAETLQGYLTSFAQDGNLNKASPPAFPIYD
ncbi:alpha/beta-hydrolase [Glonium stellatum]|uniref:Carboxylic ester hydrolase n=1 Tax=Glonium stellatum TaxID=574774 RepID=A0A8E2F6A0_9PEZI|nr:alpha/beta-hydrolase [Glonium stellatum]